jgi:predicted esterase YcpF (UPF0227 family)
LILYIHGFRTTPNSFKAKQLKSYYGNRLVVSDHSVIPNQALLELEDIIKKENIRGIIASSLGGFYATYLSEKYNLKTALINPSVKPYITTKKYLGENSKDNGDRFIWEDKHIEMLQRFKIDKKDLNLDNYFLFLQTGDEVIDYRVAKDFYSGVKLILEEGGNHRFKKFDRFFGEVEDFLKS